MLVLIVVFGTLTSSVAEQEWSVTALAGVAKEQHRGRGWDDASPSIGLSGAWTFFPSLALEADFTYAPDLFPDVPIITAKFSVVSLMGTVVYDLTTGIWQPYVAIGAGVGRTRFTTAKAEQVFGRPCRL